MQKKILITAVLLVAFSNLAKSAVSSEPISPIKVEKVKNVAMVELGKKLFFDPRLSKSGVISCNSCHNLSMGGTDNLPTSVGHKWSEGPINSPTVLNAKFNFVQFWDGRAKNLKEQAGGPIANPGEMASTHELAIEVLKSIPAYTEEFKKVFKQENVSIDQVTEAIAAFEETLVTPNSRFDKWLTGNKSAITAYELSGYKLFKENGCIACHNGEAVGGNSFQKMGLIEEYKTTNKSVGRVAVSKDESDRMNFKVPTLRNVELTYPYFHDGAAKTLKEAVQIMGRVQLGKQFSDDESSRIVAFLKTLTGDQPKFALPILPPSSETTPRVQPFSNN